MHIHNHPTNFNAIDLSLSRPDKATSTQRAADVRRKLMNGGLDIEPFESLMVNPEQESGSRQGQGQNQQQNHANNVEKLESDGTERADQLLSFWA